MSKKLTSYLIFHTVTGLNLKSILNVFRLILLVVIFQFQRVNAQDTEWDQVIGAVSNGDHGGTDVAISPEDGAVIYVGYFQGDLRPPWGNSSILSTEFNSPYGAQDGFVAKYDKNGNYQWAFKIGGDGNDIVNSIYINDDGSFFITGTVGSSASTHFTGTSVTVASSLTTSGADDMFVAKYNKNGGLVWYYTSEGSNQTVNGICVFAKNDAVYVTGAFKDNLVYPDETIIEYENEEDVFVTKFDLDGAYQWTVTAGGDKEDIPSGIVVDDTAIYVTGTFRGDDIDYRNTLGGIQRTDVNTQNDNADIFLASWDLDGTFLWNESIDSDEDNMVGGLAMYGDSLYLTGGIRKDATFPAYSGGLVSADKKADMFLSSHGKDNGSTGWVRRMTSTKDKDEIGNDINVDSRGNLYITGVYHDDLTIPGDTTFSRYRGDVLVALSFNPIGEYLWGKVAGNKNYFDTHSAGLAIVAEESRRTYVTGYFDVSTSFDGTEIQDYKSGSNIFMAKVLPACIPLNADAGEGGTVCDGLTFQLNATLSTGIGFWSKQTGPDNASFVPDNTDPSASVSVVSPGTYTFKWTEIDGLCADDSIITIIFGQKPFVDAGTGGVQCGLTYKLGAVSLFGTWNQVSGPGTSNFSLVTSRTSDVTVTKSGVYEFTWSNDNGTCSDADTIVVEFLEQPIANAGTDELICDDNLALGATLSSGVGRWSVFYEVPGASVTFEPNELAEDATIMVDKYGDYGIRWTEINDICEDHADLYLTFKKPPVANAGQDGASCDLTFPLNATLSTGSGTWSKKSGEGTSGFWPTINSTDAIVTVSEYGQYEFTWTESNGDCSDDSSITINFYEQPVADAGEGGTSCNKDFKLNASLSSGFGFWILKSGPGTASYASDNTTPNALVTVTKYGDYEFTWTETNGTCSDDQTILVSFYKQPEADPGSGGSSCDTLFNLNASITSGLGEWTKTSGLGTATFAPNNATPSATVEVTQYGSYTFTWTETNGTCSDDSSIIVDFYEQPVANAGNGGEACGSEFTFNATLTSGSGIWSQTEGPGTTSYSNNAGSPNAKASVSLFGTYTYQWTETNGTCSDFDVISVTYYEPTVANAGFGGSSCDLIFQLGATLTSGAGLWTKKTGLGDVSFSPSAMDPNAVLTVTQVGVYELTWTEINGTCVSDSSIEIEFLQQPVANAGPDMDVCELIGVLNADPSVGVGEWVLVDGAGTVDFGVGGNDPNASVIVETYGLHTFRWTEVNDVCRDSSEVTLNFQEMITADPGPIDDACELSYDLDGVLRGGTGVWTKVTGPGNVSFLPNNQSPNAKIVVDEEGLYTINWSVVNGTCLDDTTVSLSFYRQPIADAGAGSEVCGTNMALNAKLSTGTGSWVLINGPGTATFTPSNTFPDANVTVSDFGSYEFIWTETNGHCSDDSSIVVNFYEIPSPDAGIGAEACGEYYQLSALSGTYPGEWRKVRGPGEAFYTPSATESNAQLSVSAYGEYQFAWTESNAICTEEAIIDVVFYEEFDASVGLDTSVCGNSVALNGNNVDSEKKWTYRSDAGIALFEDQSAYNTPVQVNNSGIYEFLWIVGESSCKDTASMKINFQEAASLSANNDEAICQGESIELIAISNGTISWYADNQNLNVSSANLVVSPEISTNYKVVATTATGCRDSLEIGVRVDEVPTADAGPDQELDYLFTTTLAANRPISGVGSWQLTEGAGNITDINDPFTSVLNMALGENLYLWTVSNGVCPEVTDEVSVLVNDVFIPNVMTPNGDGKNDYFVIRGLANMGNNELMIFDRWGTEQYKTTNYNNDWVGQDQDGNDLPDDTYFFILTIETENTLKGYITIKR